MICVIYDSATGAIVGHSEGDAAPPAFPGHGVLSVTALPDAASSYIADGAVATRQPLDFDAPPDGALMSVNGAAPIAVAGWARPTAAGTYNLAAIGRFSGARTIVVRGWDEIRTARNALLDAWRWAVQPDSPLAPECQAAVLAFLKTLNRVTIDFASPGDVQWPEAPALSYPASKD